jgi:hypothetical protein
MGTPSPPCPPLEGEGLFLALPSLAEETLSLALPSTCRGGTISLALKRNSREAWIAIFRCYIDAESPPSTINRCPFT